MSSPEFPKTLDQPGENTPSAIVERLHINTCVLLADQIQTHGKELYEMIKKGVQTSVLKGQPSGNSEIATELNKYEINLLDLCDRAKDAQTKWRYFHLLLTRIIQYDRRNLAIQMINMIKLRNKKFRQPPLPEKPRIAESRRASLSAEVEKILGSISKKT